MTDLERELLVVVSKSMAALVEGMAVTVGDDELAADAVTFAGQIDDLVEKVQRQR